MPARVNSSLWRALLAGALIVSVTMGVRQTFGLFLAPVTSDLVLTREVFGFAIAIQNLLWGLAQPFAGMAADRFGSARIIVVGGALYLSGLLLAAGAESGAELYLSMGVLIGLGLSGTTFAVVLGAVGRLVPDDRRSMALGLVSAGGSFGQFALVPGAQYLIGQVGWINSLLGLACLAAIVPLAAAGLRGRAEAAADGTPEAASLGAAIGEAGVHRGYWLLTTGFFVCGFQVTFIATHLPSYLTDQSIAPMIGAVSLALIGFFNIIGTYLCGYLGGKYRKKNLLSYLYIGRSVVTALFLILPHSNASVILFASAMGLLWLGTVPLTSGLVGQIFGVRYMSTLFGFVFFSHQLGSFLGAWLGGYFYDVTGSYDLVWMGSIVLGLVSALLHWPINDAPLDRAAARA